MRADEVGGQQVGRELDALEVGVDGAGERLTASVLARPGTPFEQHMPVGQQADDQPLEHCPLPHDHLAELGHQLADHAALVFDECRRRHAGNATGVGREVFGEGAHEMGMYTGRTGPSVSGGSRRRVPSGPVIDTLRSPRNR